MGQERHPEQQPAQDRPEQRRPRTERAVDGGEQQVQERLPEALRREPRRVGGRIVERELGADEEDERGRDGHGGRAVEDENGDQKQRGRRRQVHRRPEAIHHGRHGDPRQPARARNHPGGHRVVPDVLVGVLGVGPVALIEQRLRGRQLAVLDVESRPRQIADDRAVLGERQGAKRQRQHCGHRDRPPAQARTLAVHSRDIRQPTNPNTRTHADITAALRRERWRAAQKS